MMEPSLRHTLGAARRAVNMSLLAAPSKDPDEFQSGSPNLRLPKMTRMALGPSAFRQHLVSRTKKRQKSWPQRRED